MENKENNQLMRAILAVAMGMASEEGITEEKESINRANEIAQDALKENPETEAGKVAREHALKMPLENPESKKFNYDEYRDQTAIPAVCAIIKKMGEVGDFLAIPSHSTPEYEKQAENAYESLSLSIFSILNEKNVGMSEYKFIFDSLKSIISAIENHVMQQVTGHRHEVMSRLLGTKNPGTGKFDANYGTYAAVIALLEKTREQTGGKMSDYFNVTDDQEKK